MNATCKKLRRTLADSNARFLKDSPAAREHVAGCERCKAFVQALAELEDGWAGLPPLDAPDSVVDALLAHPSLSAVSAGADRNGVRAERLGRWAWAPRRQSVAVWGGFAAAAVLIVIAMIEPSFKPSHQPLRARTTDSAAVGRKQAVRMLRDEPQPEPQPVPLPESTSESKTPPVTTEHDEADRKRPAGRRDRKIPVASLGSGALTVQVQDSEGNALPGATVTISHQSGKVKPYTTLAGSGGKAAFPVLRPGPGYSLDVRSPGFGTRRQENVSVPAGGTANVAVTLPAETVERVRVVATEDVVELADTSSTAKFSDEFVQDLPVPGRFYQNVLTLAPGVNDADGDGNPTVHGSRSRDFQAQVSGVSNVDPLTGQIMSFVNSDSIEEIEVVSSGAGVEFGRAQGGFARIIQKQGTNQLDGYERLEHGSVLPVQADAWWDSAAEFLEERSRVDGVDFADAHGYWSNTYVPGDSALRLLHARLAGSPSSARVPHRLALPVQQPFDEPQDGALALYLHSDRAAIRGGERALIQVGIQGASRLSGRRPAMNVALVLDARNAFDARRAALARALLEAFVAARQPQDRFSLFVAGRPGGEALPADAFRHGPLRLFLDDLFARSAGGAAAGTTRTLSLTDAALAAVGRATELDEPDAVSGSSSVVLVTTATLEEDLASLESIAGQVALDSVPLSVVGVGTDVVPSEIERLALAGQGSRRLLLDPADAVGLVDRQLAAVGRAIARAVRLNIRLAPGVDLVGIVGSERLDVASTARVRASEQAIDRRVSQSVGIVADRGEDDDGIQILIPSFFAGDSHVILLDVIAEGPGLLAEVEARFKDLVRLDNGVAQASLSVGDVPASPGPLEVNVFKNLLAWMTASALDEAGNEIVCGDAESAREIMTDYHQLLRGVSRRSPALRGDAEIARDLALLAEYRAALEAQDLDDALLATLADSLRYAGMLKVLPPPSTR